MIKKVKLGSICDIYSAGDKPKQFSETETAELNVPVYGNGRDNEGLVGFTDKAGILSKAVTVAARGSSCGVAFYRTKPYMPIVRLLSLVAKPGIDTKYLYYQVCNRHFTGAGSGQPQITIPDIADAPIHLETELEIQEALSNVLYTFDEKIANNNAICSNLEAMAKLLYDYWFVQFDFPDENGKPYKSSGGKMVWNEDLKREIPAGWGVKCISDIGTLDQNSVWPNNDMVYSHYSIPAFDDSHMPVREEGSAIESNKYLIPENCVLVSKLNPQFKRIWLIKKPQENAICSTEFLPIKAGDIGINYLYEVVNSDGFSVHLRQKASSSTGSRKRIDPENCMAFQFASDNRIAKLYNSKIASLIEQAYQIPLENQQLASLRDFLLPMLMNGQVKVG